MRFPNIGCSVEYRWLKVLYHSNYCRVPKPELDLERSFKDHKSHSNSPDLSQTFRDGRCIMSARDISGRNCRLGK